MKFRNNKFKPHIIGCFSIRDITSKNPNYGCLKCCTNFIFYFSPVDGFSSDSGFTDQRRYFCDNSLFLSAFNKIHVAYT